MILKSFEQVNIKVKVNSNIKKKVDYSRFSKIGGKGGEYIFILALVG
jgi:hypothetical protein